ncbi:hypothetical protein FB446DRAFT_840959 [Lentinula raphanica]|nr:hypothetical protein FB446DRAFT_840959 [Lentinula raphanica]
MTRPIHNLPLDVLCVILASAIFPGEVLAAPTSFNNPGSLGTVIRARNGLKVDGHVSSCLSSAVAVAGAGAGDGAVHNCDEELNGNAVRRSLTRSLKRRAKFLDGSPFFDTHAAGVHAHGQGGDTCSQASDIAQCSEQKARADSIDLSFPLHPCAVELAARGNFAPTGQGSIPVQTAQQSQNPLQGTRISEIMREVEPLVKARDSSQQQPPLPRQRARYEFCQREEIQHVPKLLAEVVQLAQSDKEPSPVKKSARMIGEQLLDIVDVCKLHVNGVDEFKAIINPVQTAKQPQVSFSEGTRIHQIEEEVKSIVQRINPSQPPLERQRARYDFCQREEIQRVPDLLTEVIQLSQSDKEPQHVRTKAISIGKDLINIADHCKLQVNGLVGFKAVVMSSEKLTHV